MTNRFTVTRQDDEAGVTRIEVTGDVDNDTAGTLAAVLVRTAEEGVSELVVDLRHVSLLSAAGIRALLVGREAAVRAGSEYRVIRAHHVVRQILAATGLLDVLGVPAAAEDFDPAYND